MALTNTERTLCSKINDDFYNITSGPNGGKGAAGNKVDQIISILRSMIFSPAGTISAAITALNNYVGTIIPGASQADLERIADFLNNCDYLTGGKAISQILGAQGALNDSISNYISSLGLDEFNAAKLIDDLLGTYSGDPNDPGVYNPQNFSYQMRQADRLINCLSNLCGGEFTSQVSEYTTYLDELYGDLNMVSDPLSSNWGELDIDYIYTTAGISASEQTTITTVTNAITSERTRVKTALNNTASSIKNAVGLGSIF